MKKRLSSVLCLCTWNMRQPGSLRDSSVSFAKIGGTSASCPAFAIHVTAKTTIVRSLLSHPDNWKSILFAGRGCLQLRREFIHENNLVPVRPGRHHADLCLG